MAEQTPALAFALEDKTVLAELEDGVKRVRLRRSHRFSYVQVVRKPDHWRCVGSGILLPSFGWGIIPILR